MARKTQLQQCFDKFNEKYFDGRLHDIELLWLKQPRVDGGRVSAYCCPQGNLYRADKIVLSTFLRRKPWLWKLVLLHEMNHLDCYLRDIEGYEKHGPQFDAGMLRLAKAGALNGLW